MPDANGFTIRREAVRNGVRLAFVHENPGGVPILLVHGYPETKRIWWRNIAPLADAERLRASWGSYETMYGKAMEDVPRLFDACPVPTLALYGEDDHVVDDTFPDRCRVAFPECIGPFVLRSCGHFVQWEAADTLNTALRWFCADLLASVARSS